MSELETLEPPKASSSASQTWLRALQRASSIPTQRDRLLSTVIDAMAERLGDVPALLSDRECFTYRELVQRANQYAHWALDQGLAKGDVVGLLMPNRPEYIAIWTGISKIGAVVALLNTNLTGPSLAHCINIVHPKHLIVASELSAAFSTAVESLACTPAIWIHGAGDRNYQRLDERIRQYPAEPPSASQLPSVTVEDRALYIYTSGTTGLPKAANVSHARVLQWSQWFAGMMDIRETDRIYNCLPMYHSIGGVLVPGATLVGGGSTVVREKFSVSQFWRDIVRWECTSFQYIGEFCRYLLNDARGPESVNHRLRLACGNGLAADVWQDFKDRFRIPRILEFYAATEGGISLFNVEEKPGSIGRIPPYLAHRFSPVLVRFDVEKGEPVRNEEGFCVRSGVNEPGEAIGRLSEDRSNLGSRYEGYTDRQASDKKILCNVFESGDAWVRTGDLMRKDEKGFFYFVDRVGDTFRWKGENVATTEVSAAICEFPGIQHAIVYGVGITGADGRAGMAAIAADDELDLSAFRAYLADRLAPYARPLFVRINGDIAVTGTFKYSRAELVRQGFDPSTTTDVIYFDHPETRKFEPIDQRLYELIQAGVLRP